MSPCSQWYPPTSAMLRGGEIRSGGGGCAGSPALRTLSMGWSSSAPYVSKTPPVCRPCFATSGAVSSPNCERCTVTPTRVVPDARSAVGSTMIGSAGRPAPHA